MLDIKKKLYGYNPEDVEKMVSELNDKIFALRQEMFASETAAQAASASGTSAAPDTAGAPELEKLEQELSTYRNQVAEKDVQIANTQSQLSQLRQQLANKQSQPAPKGPNYDIIEKVYEHAYDSSKLIVKDTKETMLSLTDSIYDDLDMNLKKASEMYHTIYESKEAVNGLIDDALGKLGNIKSVLGNLGNEQQKISDFHLMLESTKRNVYQKITGDVNDFHLDLSKIEKDGLEEKEIKIVEPVKEIEIPESVAEIEVAVAEVGQVAVNEPVVYKEPGIVEETAVPEVLETAEPVVVSETITTLETEIPEEEPKKDFFYSSNDYADIEKPKKASTLPGSLVKDAEQGDVLVENEISDNHFSLEALKINPGENLHSSDAKKFTTSDETAEAINNVSTFDALESLAKMKENITKELDMEKTESQEAPVAEPEQTGKNKVSIEHILKKYSNIKDKY